MIQNEQFTDPERSRFFFPANHETEVHPSVDLGPYPSVITHHIAYPLLRVETTAGSTDFRLPKSIIDHEFTIEEGERVRGIEASTELAARAIRWHEELRDEPSAEDREHAARIFDSLTHLIVGLDSMRQYSRSRNAAIQDSEFGKGKHVVLPLDAPAPILGNENDKYPLEYTIKGFVDNQDRMVTLREGRGTSWASWLVDMCVVSAHVRNTTELLLFDHEVGLERSLVGTLSTHPEVQAYLRHYALNHDGAEKYIPTKDSHSRLYDSEFGVLSDEERTHYNRLSTVTYWSLRYPRERLDWSFADKDILTSQ